MIRQRPNHATQMLAEGKSTPFHLILIEDMRRRQCQQGLSTPLGLIKPPRSQEVAKGLARNGMISNTFQCSSSPGSQDSSSMRRVRATRVRCSESRQKMPCDCSVRMSKKPLGLLPALIPQQTLKNPNSAPG